MIKRIRVFGAKPQGAMFTCSRCGANLAMEKRAARDERGMICVSCLAHGMRDLEVKM